jgi:cell division topological specificity factor
VDFLRKLFGGGGTASAKEAKERLRIVLIHDRTDISPQLLENLRVEMIAVLTKYMDIDESKIEMDLDHDESAVALVANIPVLRIKRGVADVADNDSMEVRLPPRAEPSRNHNIRSRRHK